MKMQEAIAEAKKQGGLAWFMHKEGLGVASSFGSDRSCAKFTSVQRAWTAPDLDSLSDDIIIERITPMDASLVGRIHAIFAEAYRRHSSEMFLHIGWNPVRKRYFIAAPKCQAVSMGFLRYNATRGRFVGTIHSHGSMGAFFSSEDDANEKGDANTAPGLYAVMGSVMSGGKPDIVASLAGLGMRKNITEELMPECTPYDLKEREARYWLRTLQATSFIYSQKTGFHLVSPQGEALRWAEKAEDLLPYAEKMDKIQPVYDRKETHESVISLRSAGKTVYGTDYSDLFHKDYYSSYGSWRDTEDAWPKRSRRKKTNTEKLSSIIDSTTDLESVVAGLSEEDLAELGAAVDNVREACKQKKEQEPEPEQKPSATSSFWDAAESDFSLWTQ